MRSNNSQSQGQKRGRNRSNNNNNNRRGGSNRQAFDSNGPNVRIRGTAVQIYDKYQAMARDATSSGDRVLAESYYQWAEHYYRIANADIEQRNRRAAQAAEQEAEAQSSDDGKGNRSEDEGAEATLITPESKEADADRKSRDGSADDEQDGGKPVTQQVLDLANDDDVPADASNDEDAAPEKETRPRKTQTRRRRAPRAASMNNPADLAAAVSSPDSGD